MVAACGGSGEATTTTSSPATTSTSPTTPDAVLLSYDLRPGASLTFVLELDQTMDMTTTGNPSVLDDEEMPREMTLHVSGPTTITYSVAEGPTDGTFEVTVTSDLSGLEFTGTIDGEATTADDIPEFAEMEPISTSFIVDEKGNLIGGGGMDMPNDLFGDLFGGLGGMGGAAPGMATDPGRFFGPVLPDDEVSVGDTWTETIETPLMGDDVATTQTSSTVVGIEELDGVQVFVIETVAASSEIRFDMAELLLALFEGFMGSESSEEDLEMLELLRDQLRFVFTVDASESHMTTKFDPDRGLPLETEVHGQNHMAMDVNVPDDETGEMVSFTLDMNVTQRMVYRLTDASGF
jgi:hypothetical protein